MVSTWALSTDGQRPHQFRTKNDLIKPQQTRSKSNGNPAKSTNLIDIRPLITVWLHVRVLPGPPGFAREASEGCRAEAHLGEGGLFGPRATARQAKLNEQTEPYPESPRQKRPASTLIATIQCSAS